MDGYEASRIVLSRLQKIDPENASRIMGLLLIQDHGDKEMIRLAFGPESLLHSLILKSTMDLTALSSSSSLLTPLTIPDLDDPSSGFGWKPCLYYGRGYCKNGGSCRFLHTPLPSPSAFPYSPKQLIRMASRQIYLTFPADSSFREEDVSNYFSIYGPVQDVRIPYQHKRMFGFVTFVYPDTVKLILAKGNPHFVCDARVLVKPYKEKPKLTLPPPDNNRKQQMERGGDFSPSALDSFHLSSPGGGASVFYNSSQDLMWTRKMEEQAVEVQSRRLMNLQLLDVNKHHNHNHQRPLSTIPSPTHFSPRPFPGLDEQMGMSNGCLKVSTGKESPVTNSNAQESLEHNLPDSPFASPTKASSSDYFTDFSNANATTGDPQREDTSNTNSAPSLLLPSSLDMASFQSFNCQASRFSSGHGGIGMFAGTGGSTFPVGI